jgi:hypothetical protein
MTIDTGMRMTIARPDIITRSPKRKPSQYYRLTTASEESLPILKEETVELTSGWGAHEQWIFFAEITSEFKL